LEPSDLSNPATAGDFARHDKKANLLTLINTGLQSGDQRDARQ